MVESVYQIDGNQSAIVATALRREVNILRETHGPVIRATMPYGGDGWLVLGYDEVKQLTSSPFISTDVHGKDVPRMRLNNGAKPPWPKTISMYDGSEHLARRRLLTKHLSVKRVKALEPQTTEYVESLIDEVVALGPGVDVIKEIADVVPVAAICDLLGVDFNERYRFVPATQALIGGTVTDPAEGDRLIQSVKDYFAEVIKKRRTAPGNDFLSSLIHDTQTNEVFTEDDLNSLGFTILSAGHDATTGVMGGLLYFLAHSPQLFQQLKSDESLIPGALEEFLRYLPGGTGPRSRVATQDIEIGGVTIRAGEGAIFWVHAANFDESVYSDPECFDIARDEAPHLLFGYGPHGCLGQQLARMELRVVLTSILRRFDRFDAVHPSANWREGLLIRGPKSLRVTW